MINKVLINDVEYDVQDGLVYKDTATEELDSGVFQILNSPEINLEPMQKVVIEFANGDKKYMLINTWVEENATFDTNLKNYIINYISETKKLERVQMPNTAITQPLGYNDENKRKYDLYIQRCVDNYIKKIYPEIEVSTALKNAMSNVIAVEEQFTTPNTKEYLNNILAKLSYLIKLENNWLTYVDLSTKNNPIDENKLFLKTSNQTIEDYYSNIYTDLQNVQSKEETIYNEFVGVRAPNQAVLTTDNAVVQLSHNINKLKKVTVYCQCTVGKKENVQYVQATIYGDDYKLIKEKSEYDLLKVSNEISMFDEEYKRMNLYFTRGSNTIEGLSYRESTWLAGIDSVFPAIENIIVKLGKDKGYILELVTDIRQLMFEVTYSAIDDVSVDFEKKKNTKSVVRDNQTDSIVDLEKFGLVQQEKINRLGNEAITIAGRYDSLDDVPQLLDYIDDYVLAEREMVIYSDFVEFKGVLYKNYVKRNVFYGVNAKLRNTQLLMPNEAVVRKELTKEKFTFSFDDKSEDKTTQRYLLGKLVSNNFSDETIDINNYTQFDFLPIQIATCRSNLEYGDELRYKLEPDVRKAHNSITVNFKWLDNINVGVKISDFKETGGYGQRYVTYTDKIGELKSLVIDLYDRINIEKKYAINYVNDFPEYDPVIPTTNRCFYSKQLIRNKDNREILNETIQFEFNAEKDIFFNSRLLDATPFFLTYKEPLYVWISQSEKYNAQNKDKVLTSAIRMEKDLRIDYNDFLNFINNNVLFNRIKLYNNNDKVDLTNVVSWVLADINGNVYIAVNKRDSDTQIATEIYLNKEE